MSGLTIYTADYDPMQVYATGDGGRDSWLVEQAVRYGDGPLALLAEFDGQGGRVVWSLKARRGAATNRTEYFLADYGTDEPDLFRSLADELTALAADDWTFHHEDDLRWDAGFDLWRVPGDVPDLSPGERDELFDRLGDPEPAEDGPLVFGVRDYRTAFAVVRAVQEAGVDCSVAVGSDGDPGTLAGVDLVLEPGADGNFVPASPAAEAFLGRPAESAGGDGDADAASENGTSRDPTPDARNGSANGGDLAVASRLSAALLVAVLGFSAYSFVSIEPVHPISGLAGLGGLAGALAALVVLGDRLFPAMDGPVGSRLQQRPRLTVVVAAYGTVSGFLFPTVVRLGGIPVTGDMWVFGPVSTPSAAAPSVAVYLAMVTAVGAGLVWLERRGEDAAPTDWLPALAGAHLLFGAGVLVATALADALWFGLLPSVAG